MDKVIDLYTEYKASKFYIEAHNTTASILKVAKEAGVELKKKAIEVETLQKTIKSFFSFMVAVAFIAVAVAVFYGVQTGNFYPVSIVGLTYLIIRTGLNGIYSRLSVEEELVDNMKKIVKLEESRGELAATLKGMTEFMVQKSSQ